jgi:hypothetical protein
MHATRFAVWLAVKIETRRKAERIASCNRAQSKGGGGRPVKFPRCHFRASRSRASPPLFAESGSKSFGNDWCSPAIGAVLLVNFKRQGL